jgi:hypothetical protein
MATAKAKTMTELTTDLIEKYIACNYYHRTSFHFDGYEPEGLMGGNPWFHKLIDRARPGENEQIKAYRREIYKSITRMPCDKVVNSLRKITKASDYRIDYKGAEVPAIINEEETLEEYCEQYMPIYKSVTNWFTQVGMRFNLIDPNGAYVVLPYSYDVKANEFVKPIPYTILSENICEFKENDFILYRSDKVYSFVSKGRKYEEYVYVFINNKEVLEVYKEDFDGKYKIVPVYQFSFGKLPAFRPGAVHWKIVDNMPLFKSLIDGMLPFLDIAAREWSDLEAEVVQHMYSTMWYYASQDCTQCKGSGKVQRAGKPIVCGHCDGSGKMKLSPYNSIKVNPQQLGENQIPTPPAGYIEKPTQIVEIQDKRINGHITNALAAIHMEFLTQLNQSGVAKAYDRDELNNWVYGCAYHFVENIIKPVYELINDFRYEYIVPNAKLRDEMLPEIGVPTKYELITANIMGEQVKQARDAQMDSVIIDELEYEYAKKQFNNDGTVMGKMYVEKAHDPFGTLTEQALTDLYLSGAIPKEDYILSVYIGHFIEKAINEYDNFLEMEYDQQAEILRGYAQEKIVSSMPSKQIAQELSQEEKVLQKLQSVSPLVANSILDSLSEEQVLALVGLKKDKTKEAIMKPIKGGQPNV